MLDFFLLIFIHSIWFSWILFDFILRSTLFSYHFVWYIVWLVVWLGSVVCYVQRELKRARSPHANHWPINNDAWQQIAIYGGFQNQFHVKNAHTQESGLILAGLTDFVSLLFALAAIIILFLFCFGICLVICGRIALHVSFAILFTYSILWQIHLDFICFCCYAVGWMDAYKWPKLGKKMFDSVAI